MVKLDKIVTKAGDTGRTRLATGEEVPKASARVDAYGTVDELNCVVGVARLHTKDDARLDPILARVQNDLFDLGADLSTPQTASFEALRITDPQVDRLEAELNVLHAAQAPLTSFVLPGGSAAAAHLHLARATARRAERAIARLMSEDTTINPACIRYANRLSDLLFVMARTANKDGATDVLWKPGANR
ncbi:MAG: cob(I)yrinic acid a,c-diamide adenosyltransferase [Hyphomonadaceae bacterium]|nr:cob(I)yrinic acid a,c-diamide adenosyltransferase [Hyphomonadaceae bacterium]MBX3510106.1 cob(I)yrinic acid a,c-diamide adenosyltransferase [Hyphomonadaceae bacterium]